MVKTRHSGDIDIDSPPKFLSLTNEKSRQSVKSGDEVEDGETPERAYREPRGAYNIFDDKVVESRLRPRIGPSRAYNYLDVDSSDEEIIRRRSRHHPTRDYSPERRRSRFSQSRQIKQEMLDEQQGRPRRLSRRRSSLHEDLEHSMEDEEDDDDHQDRQSRRTSRQRQHREVDEEEDNDKSRRRRGGRHSQDSVEEDNDHVETSTSRSRTSRRQRSADENHEENGDRGPHKRRGPTEEEVEDHLIRRSSRTRRQVYDTLNQSYLVSFPGRSKQDSDDHNDHSDGKDQDSDNCQEFSDMYSRVKRQRVKVKRNMYGVPVNGDSDSEQDMEENKNNSKQEEDEDENGEDEEVDGKDEDNNSGRATRQKGLSLRKKEPQIVKSYSLREHKPRTDLYKAPVKEPRIRRMHHSVFAVTPTKKSTNQTYHSPAHRRKIRKRSAFHSSSSSTSSSDSESSDEKSFKRRKTKSMAKARSTMMPMNFSTNALPSASVIKDRVKSGASLADVEPMNIDRSVTFNSIGGLGKHIRALKEMVVFPLLYERVFQRFKVDPPRGVLFYGPPGTGKTLVARALANECSQGDRRVAFFMRKGADCLSKWVGESERQLRLLFDQAYKFRPSIIFFDEIDGLAPVRSSRQDQIHSSIVSTLLALMDGLDSRGEIVVIGATNRIDSLDPALRRPGRFDREFLFPLPSLEARKQILKIHTTSWSPRLNDHFIGELAEKCVGYCGADLKALCTEAAMMALRRRYPQIYITNEALQLDVSSINVSAKDFFDAVHNIIPTSQRAVNTPARALSARVHPLLQRQLEKVVIQLNDMFPPSLAQTASLDAAVTTSQAQALAENGVIWEELASDEDEDAPSIFVPSTSNKGSKANRRSAEDMPSTSLNPPTYLNFISYATSRPATFRPRLMLVGTEGQGQTTYIAPAVIHKMENLPVHVLDLPALYAVTAKTPEESCANVFHEAKRKCPSIVYLPYINQWWDVMAETLRATLLTLIQDLDPTLPLLLLATSEQPYHTLDPMLQTLFSQISGEVIYMTDPNTEERRTFFKDLLLRQTSRPPPQKKQAGEILKLLKESKRANPALSVIKLRKASLRTRRRKPFSLPNYVYPFGSDDIIESRIICGEKKAGLKDSGKRSLPTCNKASIHLKSPGKLPDFSWSETLNTRFNPSLKMRTKRSRVTKRISQRPLNAGPSPKSTHGMVLRSRANVGKLNSNQSARDSGSLHHTFVYKSKQPACSSSDSCADFKKPAAPQSRNSIASTAPYYLRGHCDRKCDVMQKHIKKTNTLKSCSHHVHFQQSAQQAAASKALNRIQARLSKSHDTLTSRHQRYVRRLHKLEVKLAEAGPSHTAECLQPHIRNSHCSLSARHKRYLKRLKKLDAALGHVHSSSSLSPLNPDMPLHKPVKFLTTKPSSVLSCGSFQMLYKSNRGSSRNYMSRRHTSELILPLNLRDLQPARFQNSSSFYQSYSTSHISQKARPHLKANVGNRSGFLQPPYNLRPRRSTTTAQRMLEVLPKAAPPKPRELTKGEMKLLVEKEELTLMELRIFLRDVLNKLGSDKKFAIFAKPVNIEDAPDYYEVIEHPMDLSTMMAKIDLHEYSTVRAFMNDVDLICSNALEYNPNRGPMDRVIRHRACALKDTAYAIIKTELDKDFEKTCVEIEESRKRRDEKSSTVPNFYYTKPNSQQQSSSSRSHAIIPSYLEHHKPVRSIPKPEGERFSRRVRGLNIDPVPPLEAVEKVYKGAKSGNSPTRDKNNSNEDSGTPAPQTQSFTKESTEIVVADSDSLNVQKITPIKEDNLGDSERNKASAGSGSQPLSTSSNKKRKTTKCVWCKPRRKRPRFMSPRQPSLHTRADKKTEEETSHDEGGEEEEEGETVQESQTPENHSLQVDTTEEVESNEQKSPSRVSTRTRSPAAQVASSAKRVSTRRSSMSPHGSGPASHPSPSASLNQGSTDHPTGPSKSTDGLETHQTVLTNDKEDVLDQKESVVISAAEEAAVTESHQSLPSHELERSKVVKRLDLDSVTADSGVGSSLESNGDSRDSMDQRGEGDSTPQTPAPVLSAGQDANHNCSAELKKRASAILNEPNKTVVIDKNRLTSLLNRLVARTDGYNVERLEKIYSHLSQIIFRHRHTHDKTRMVLDLERKVDDLTKIIPTTSSQCH